MTTRTNLSMRAVLLAAMLLSLATLSSIVAFAVFDVRWWAPVESGDFREGILVALHILALMAPWFLWPARKGEGA